MPSSTPLDCQLRTLRLSLIVASLLSPISLATHAQTCAIFEKQNIEPPIGSSPFHFGSGLALNITMGLIGSPQDEQGGIETGAVYPLTLDENGIWQIGEPFVGSDSAEGDEFGAAIDIDGTTAVVGAPGHSCLPDDLHIGDAYVYTYDGTQWTEDAVLSVVEDHPQFWSSFGRAVAISGDVIAVGNSTYDGSDLSEQNFGAAYIFRLVDDRWQLEERITAPDRQSAGDGFGFSVDLDGDVLIVSSRGDDDLGEGSGSAYVFHHDGDSWQFAKKLLAPNGAAGDLFGTSVALDGNRAIIGAPASDALAADSGSAYVFMNIEGAWVFQQQLVDAAGQAGDTFGTAVDIDGDAIVVGAPYVDVTYPDEDSILPNGGLVCVFRWNGQSWSHQYNLRAKWNDPTPPFELMHLGSAVAIDSNTILAGMPDGLGDKPVFRYDRDPEDCDVNGVPDQCDPDCNTNNVPDSCDLNLGTASDCNASGTLDVCEAQPNYVSDSNQHGLVWGLPDGGDMVCLNAYVVAAGAEHLTHVVVPWPALVPPDLSLTLLIYDDPNNDGDPSDAVLLQSIPASIGMIEYWTPDLRFTTYPVPRTFVGEAGESFFVGVLLSLPSEFYAAFTAFRGTGENWLAIAAYGGLDPMNLGDSRFLEEPPHWMIRALALDCNDNGVWDQCDIDDGLSADSNGNGIPDECEAKPCPADLNDDGSVGPADLANLLAAWGTDPGGPPDFDDDNIVGPADLAELLASWGTCR